MLGGEALDLVLHSLVAPALPDEEEDGQPHRADGCGQEPD
jgi:hypothetical protein